MIINIIEKGFIVTAVELDFPPDNEDRIVFEGDVYVVNDRVFHIGKNKYLDVYVDCISNKH